MNSPSKPVTRKRVPSTASVYLHPIHPILVIFPIAFFAGAFGADILYWWTRDAFFARGALWLLGAGLAGGVPAALSGMTDFFTIRYVREQIGSWSHFLAAIFTLALATANFLTRWEDPIAQVLPLGLLLSADTALMLVFTGWLGGKLTFRHLIGTYIEEEEKAALAAIKSASPPPETRSE